MSTQHRKPTVAFVLLALLALALVGAQRAEARHGVLMAAGIGVDVRTAGALSRAPAPTHAADTPGVESVREALADVREEAADEHEDPAVAADEPKVRRPAFASASSVRDVRPTTDRRTRGDAPDTRVREVITARETDGAPDAALASQARKRTGPPSDPPADLRQDVPAAAGAILSTARRHGDRARGCAEATGRDQGKARARGAARGRACHSTSESALEKAPQKALGGALERRLGGTPGRSFGRDAREHARGRAVGRGG